MALRAPCPGKSTNHLKDSLDTCSNWGYTLSPLWSELAQKCHQNSWEEVGFGFPLNTLYITWGCNHYFLTTISSNFPVMVVLIYMAKRCLFSYYVGPEWPWGVPSAFFFLCFWFCLRYLPSHVWHLVLDRDHVDNHGPHGTGQYRALGFGINGFFFFIFFLIWQGLGFTCQALKPEATWCAPWCGSLLSANITWVHSIE